MTVKRRVCRVGESLCCDHPVAKRAKIGPSAEREVVWAILDERRENESQVSVWVMIAKEEGTSSAAVLLCIRDVNRLERAGYRWVRAVSAEWEQMTGTLCVEGWTRGAIGMEICKAWRRHE